MKEEFKKITIVVLAIIILPLFVSGQYLKPRQENNKVGHWQYFFKPTNNIFLDSGPDVWLFKPVFEMSILKLTPSNNKERVFDVSAFQSVGLGIGYQHFININGLSYNNYGFNILVLFDAIPKETTPLNISAALTFNTLRYMSFGGGYDLGIKKGFMLIGFAYNFN